MTGCGTCPRCTPLLETRPHSNRPSRTATKDFSGLNPWRTATGSRTATKDFSGLNPWRTATGSRTATGFGFILADMWWRWLTRRETWGWIAIAVLVRGAYFWIFLHEWGIRGAWYGWGYENGDTPGYFEPIESLLRGEGYQPDFRMPGYGLPYLLFRLVTTVQGAGTLMVFAQCALGVLSVVVLARCAALLGAPRWMCTAVCIAFALLGRVALYDVQWFTESFCTSAMIIALHGWLAHLRSGSLSALLWSGSWAAWTVFLRPVHGVWLLLLALGLLFLVHAGTRRKILFSVWFLLPFLLTDSLWTLRNWNVHREFAPLSRGVVMPEILHTPMLPIMRFLQATGGNYLPWDRSAHIRWLNLRDGLNGAHGSRKDRNVVMPAFALCDRISIDSLNLIAMDMERYGDTLTTYPQRVALLARIAPRCERFIGYYAHDEPWQYHVMARLRLTKLFLGRAGMAGLFDNPPRCPAWFYGPLDLLDRLMYWAVLIGGLVAAMVSITRWRRDRLVAWLGGLTLVCVFIVPWGLRFCEGRYLVPIYPWLLLMLAMAADRIAVARARRTGS